MEQQKSTQWRRVCVSIDRKAVKNRNNRQYLDYGLSFLSSHSFSIFPQNTWFVKNKAGKYSKGSWIKPKYNYQQNKKKVSRFFVQQIRKWHYKRKETKFRKKKNTFWKRRKKHPRRMHANREKSFFFMRQPYCSFMFRNFQSFSLHLSLSLQFFLSQHLRIICWLCVSSKYTSFHPFRVVVIYTTIFCRFKIWDIFLQFTKNMNFF